MLNIFFFVFHTALTLFNLIGWAWKRTRLLNLITIVLTFASWLVLGIWYGWGYCPCTDWHWDVRARLGYEVKTHSYIEFLAETLTGLDFDPAVIEPVTIGGLVVALVVSLVWNARDWRHNKLKNGSSVK